MSLAKRMLDLAARHALRAAGDVEPNPLVGCVLARGEQVLGIGHHRRFGGLHAEREALASCKRLGNDPRGATAYVTLEPCNAQGKQPACVDALLESGITHVVYAVADPNPGKSGGAARLASHGVAVEYSCQSPLACSLAQPFLRRLATGRPWVIAKWAQTIDGRIATRTGESKWISNPRSRMRVHRLRARVDAMLTGMGTILADDPMLNARDVRRVRRLARRVVVDSDLDIPPECALVETASEIPTIVACDQDLSSSGITTPRRSMLRDKGVEIIGVRADERGGIDLTHMLERLHADFGVASVLVEAGPRLLGSLMRDDLIDEAVVYIAPLLFGDEMARSSIEGHIVGRLASVPRFGLHRVARVGDDIEVTYRRRLA
ncbi:MAG: bifunctional diaminohydroxyphosphoribosylaminopyrimidine deaminase/5-amino-6-(5-phosphoribosylamino)uracil reductase RibD [Phycisphaerales bacterium]|nr:bifunctional diaminohydroxyphosphoribosylaminopyrimidine deaminase/5-amino-6-(5-phosphoribosylamino)uracil reductase RibD [Phycisphaerales bacterium]